LREEKERNVHLLSSTSACTLYKTVLDIQPWALTITLAADRGVSQTPIQNRFLQNSLFCLMSCINLSLK